jgi:hypothetical protein
MDFHRFPPLISIFAYAPGQLAAGTGNIALAGTPSKKQRSGCTAPALLNVPALCYMTLRQTGRVLTLSGISTHPNSGSR